MARSALATWCSIAVLALASCSATPPPNDAPIGAPSLRVAADTGETLGEAPAAANPDGKYRRLLAVFRAPEDEEKYGAFKEYGVWGPGEWAGAMRPRGHWVYAAPSWYVWESRVSGQRADDPSSANGKYAGLIKTLDVPDDQATYGDYNDYGAWGPGDYAGAPQPAGYWVYVAPTWYVWRDVQ